MRQHPGRPPRHRRGRDVEARPFYALWRLKDKLADDECDEDDDLDGGEDGDDEDKSL